MELSTLQVDNKEKSQKPVLSGAPMGFYQQHYSDSQGTCILIVKKKTSDF